MLYQLSYPAVGGRIIRKLSRFVKNTRPCSFPGLFRMGGERGARPVQEFGTVLHDLDRDFVIGRERLAGIRAERLHAVGRVTGAAGVIGTKVQPTSMQNAEELRATVQAVATKSEESKPAQK